MKVKLIIIFLLSFGLSILHSIFSPILMETYLVDCHGSVEKMFTACVVNQSSWQFTLDQILVVLSVWGAPIFLAVFTVALTFRKNLKRSNLIVLPLIMLALLFVFRTLFGLLFLSTSLNQPNEFREYVMAALLPSILVALISLVWTINKKPKISINQKI